MSCVNGQSREDSAISTVTTATALVASTGPQFSPEKIKELFAALEVPFDDSQIEWRVMNTSKNGHPLRGQVVPYADQRAYTDRLNALFTPAGWTRKYVIHTSANFERSKDQKLVAKVLVTCELTVFGLGSHSAVGEEFSDNENAGTAAEAQAFKRSCACFGLGRYLYYFTGTWVDLDDHKRPKTVPQLAGWATPEGWRQGLRPNQSARTPGSTPEIDHSLSDSAIAQIEAMAQSLGRGLYRGLLRDLARVWNPRDIQNSAVQQQVLEHMRTANVSLRRLEEIVAKTGPAALVSILRSLGLASLERVDNLEVLKRIIMALEDIATNRRANGEQRSQ
jgi:hypothetical protein